MTEPFFDAVENIAARRAAARALLVALKTLVAALPEDGEWEHFIDIKDAARAAIAQAEAAGIKVEG